jgi:cytochrome c biogenesis protein CcmG/thiol:disulfide interchange protein DsbE
MVWKRLAIGLVVIVPILALLAYGFTRDPREIPSPLIARPAAPFTLTLFDGRQLRLDELRGKVVFLNFWASWCVPCRAEARTLEAAWQRYRNRDVVFVGANIQDTEAEAGAFLAEFGVTYPNGIDTGSRIAIEYGVYGIPETFFIDRQGRITYKHIGGLDWQTLTAKLEDALLGVASAAEGKGEFRSIR